MLAQCSLRSPFRSSSFSAVLTTVALFAVFVLHVASKVDSSTGSADSNSRLKSGKIRVDTLNTASCNPESEASAASTVCLTSSLTSPMDNAALLIIVINSSRYCRVDPFRDNIQDELTFFYYLEYQNPLLVMLGLPFTIDDKVDS